MTDSTFWQRFLSAAGFCLLAAVLVWGTATPVAAQNPALIVTKTADTSDGVCDADCSLREAILAAENAPGPDLIQFQLPPDDPGCSLGYGCPVVLTLGPLPAVNDSSGSTAIDGTGWQLSIVGWSLQRVLEVGPDGTLLLRGLAVVSGYAPQGGGILNAGTLELELVELQGNSAVTLGGGAIANYGQTTIRTSTLSSNSALQEGSGAAPVGGAVYNAPGASLTVIDSTFKSNTAMGTAGLGGGIYNAGSLQISGSTFADNGATLPEEEEPDGLADLPTQPSGGAIFQADTGSLSVENSTFSANRATQAGGAIYSMAGGAVSYSTFYGNTAVSGGALAVDAAGGALALDNALLTAGETGANCAAAPAALLDFGGTISSDDSCPLDHAASTSNVDPLLQLRLRSNGGPTQTHALQPGSPALDAASGACPAVDQRGVDRPRGAACDPGAYEYAFHATLRGTVMLQGRRQPGEAGLVTVLDNRDQFAPRSLPFDPVSGAFEFVDLAVGPGGSDLQIVAAHDLYLDQALASLLIYLDNDVTLPQTTMRGGDANNNGTVDVLDLSCIAGSFDARHPGAGDCGGAGGTDLNRDGMTDIRDLAICGGNYQLTGPQPW